MIAGSVANRRAYVPLVVRGPQGQQAELETVLDTGFTGFLTLPPDMVRALALPFVTFENARLAGGARARLEVYASTAWCGASKSARRSSSQ